MIRVRTGFFKDPDQSEAVQYKTGFSGTLNQVSRDDKKSLGRIETPRPESFEAWTHIIFTWDDHLFQNWPLIMVQDRVGTILPARHVNPPHKTRVYPGWAIRSYYPLWAICGFYEYLVIYILGFQS